MTEGGDTKIVGLFVIGEGVLKFSSSSDAVGKVMDAPTVVRAVLLIFGMTNCNVDMAVICLLHFFPNQIYRIENEYISETIVKRGGHKYATHFHKIETYIHTSLYLLHSFNYFHTHSIFKARLTAFAKQVFPIPH